MKEATEATADRFLSDFAEEAIMLKEMGLLKERGLSVTRLLERLEIAEAENRRLTAIHYAKKEDGRR